MRLMRSTIGGVRIQAPDYGLNLSPGQVVDLDERLPAGGTLADVTRPEWFEPLALPPQPARPVPVPASLLPAKPQKRTAPPLAPATPKE